MLKRQAEWQRSRKDLSWPEKMRLVEQVRDSVELLRQSNPAHHAVDDNTPKKPPKP